MKLSSSDRKALVKLAASMPKGSAERRAILGGLKVAAERMKSWKTVKSLNALETLATKDPRYALLLKWAAESSGTPSSKNVRGWLAVLKKEFVGNTPELKESRILQAVLSTASWKEALIAAEKNNKDYQEAVAGSKTAATKVGKIRVRDHSGETMVLKPTNKKIEGETVYREHGTGDEWVFDGDNVAPVDRGSVGDWWDGWWEY